MGSAEIYYPVIAAVTGPVLTFAPPAFLGTYSKNWPLPISMLRGLSPTLKVLFSPRRVIVLSLNVSSLRDWAPVCTAVPWRTSSFTVAGCGDAFDGSSLTSWMTWVTFASLSSSAPTWFGSQIASDAIGKMSRKLIFMFVSIGHSLLLVKLFLLKPF